MSRTTKGKKGIGAEYSSKRGSKAGMDYATPGTFAKNQTNRWERRDGKDEIQRTMCEEICGKATPDGSVCTMAKGHEDGCL